LTEDGHVAGRVGQVDRIGVRRRIGKVVRRLRHHPAVGPRNVTVESAFKVILLMSVEPGVDVVISISGEKNWRLKNSIIQI
jgi:hypothetical protein